MTEETTIATPKKQARGFALLTKERLTEISRMGGKAVPAEKRQFAAREGFAAQCGRKGGLAVAANKRTFSMDRDAASCAGKKGVEVRRACIRAQREKDNE